jgi:hypothetical protein
MTKQKPNVKSQTTDKSGVMIGIDRAPNGEWKSLGGGERGQWNTRLSDLVIRALPIDQRNAGAVSQAGSAVAAGVVDLNPADPVEGMLISQIVVANEAALSLYQRAWACPPDHHFEAHTGGRREGLTAALLPATTDRPMEIIEPMRKKPVAIQREGQRRNDQQPHAQGSRRSKVPRNIEANGKALSCACLQRLEGLPNARGSRRRSRGREEWELPARR